MGATNVIQMSLYVAHSQSYQLYQMTYVERQKFDEEEDDGRVSHRLLAVPPRSVIGSLSQAKI